MCLVFAVQPGSVYKTMYLLLDLWHSWRLQQYRMWSRNRQGVTVSPSVSAYVCVPSPLWLPKETHTHTIFTSSSERKKENKLHHFVVVLLLLLLSVQHLHSSPECQAHEWLEDGDALTFMFPEMGCGFSFSFHTQQLMSRFQQMWREWFPAVHVCEGTEGFLKTRKHTAAVGWKVRSRLAHSLLWPR